jgi:hypothetical protein
MGSRYRRIVKRQGLDGKWKIVLEIKGQSGRILFEHIDREKASLWEKLYREGRIFR